LLNDVTREAVLAAVAEYDQLGRETESPRSAATRHSRQQHAD